MDRVRGPSSSSTLPANGEMPMDPRDSIARNIHAHGGIAPASKLALPRYSRRRWGVIGSFMGLAALNGFVYMDFSSVMSVSRRLFDDASPQNVNWLYSASLLSAIPMVLPTIAFIHKRMPLAMWLLVFFNTAGTLVRYFAVMHGDYILALVSSVLIGFGSAIAFCGFTVLPTLYFPPSQRPFAVSLGVQSNYFGWCLGAKLVPQIVGGDQTGMINLCLGQAIFALALLLPVLIFIRKGKKEAVPVEGNAARHRHKIMDASRTPSEDEDQAPSRGDKDEGQPHIMSRASSSSSSWSKNHPIQELPLKGYTYNPLMELGALFGNWRFVLFGSCYSLMAGISFALPAVQDAILEDIGFDPVHTSWTNFAFIMVGVCSGLVCGFFFPEPRFSTPQQLSPKTRRQFSFVLQAFFLVASLSCTSIAVLTALGRSTTSSTSNANGASFVSDGGSNKDALLYVGLLISFVFAGASSLGFIGIAFTHLVLLTAPLSEAYSSGMVFIFAHASGAILTVVASGGPHAFTILATLCWIASFTLLIAFVIDQWRFNRRHVVGVGRTLGMPQERGD